MSKSTLEGNIGVANEELEAMTAIAGALEGLDDEARLRALRWASDKYLSDQPRTPTLTSVSEPRQEAMREVIALPRSASEDETSADVETAEPQEPEFAVFADLFDAAAPKTETDRALVAAYWVQVIEGTDGLTSHVVQGHLRNLGYQVSNIARSMEHLTKTKPTLVNQTSKSSKAKQARKTFKVTTAGERAVKAMLGNDGA